MNMYLDMCVKLCVYLNEHEFRYVSIIMRVFSVHVFIYMCLIMRVFSVHDVDVYMCITMLVLCVHVCRCLCVEKYACV